MPGDDEEDEEEEDDVDHRCQLEAGGFGSGLLELHLGRLGVGGLVAGVLFGLVGKSLLRGEIGGVVHLGGDEGHDVGGSGFEFGEVAGDASAENGVEDHGGDADDESGSGGDEGFGNAGGELHLADAFEVALGDLEEGFDHAYDGAEEANHGGDGSDVSEPGDALSEDARLAGAFCFSNLADFVDIGVRVFGGEVEGFLGEAGDEFAAAVAVAEEGIEVAFAQHGFSGVHEAVGDNGAAADGEGVEDDENEGDEGEGGEGKHHDSAVSDDFHERDFAGGFLRIRREGLGGSRSRCK